MARILTFKEMEIILRKVSLLKEKLDEIERSVFEDKFNQKFDCFAEIDGTLHNLIVDFKSVYERTEGR